MQAAVSLVPDDIPKEWAIWEGIVSWKNCDYSLLMRKVSLICTYCIGDNNKLSQLYWKSKKFEFWVHLKRKMSERFSFMTTLSHTHMYIQHSQIIACLVIWEEEGEEEEEEERRRRRRRRRGRKRRRRSRRRRRRRRRRRKKEEGKRSGRRLWWWWWWWWWLLLWRRQLWGNHNDEALQNAMCYRLQRGRKKLLPLHALVQRCKKTVNKYGGYTEN